MQDAVQHPATALPLPIRVFRCRNKLQMAHVFNSFQQLLGRIPFLLFVIHSAPSPSPSSSATISPLFSQ